MSKQASFAMFNLRWSSATLFGQTMNALSPEERAQGGQLLFDSKTLAGRHVSAPAQGGGRAGPAQSPQTGQVGTPKPCVATSAEPTPGVPAGGSHWDVVGRLLPPCGEPTGDLTPDRSYKNFVLSIEFKCGEEDRGRDSRTRPSSKKPWRATSSRRS